MHIFLRLPIFAEEEKTHQAAVLFLVLWTVMLAVTMMELFDIWMTPVNILRWLLIIGIVDIVCFSLLYINWLGYTRQVGITLTVSLWGLITGLAYTGEGIIDPSTPAFFIIIALSGLVLGRKAVIFTSIGFIFTGLGLTLVDSMRSLPVNQGYPTPLTLLVSYSFYAIIIATVQYINIETLKNAFLRVGSEKTERKKAEYALQISKDFTTNLIETANVIVISYDLNGYIIVLNQAAEEITGYNRSELEGRNWLELIVPRNHYPEGAGKFRQLIAWGSPKCFESPILTKTGEERYITWQSNEVYNQRQVVGLITFGVDITERKHHERELEIIATVSSALRIAQTQAEMFQIVLTQLKDLFRANYVTLAARYANDDNINFESICGEDSQESFAQLFSSKGDLNSIINTNEIYLNNDIQHNPLFSQYDQFAGMFAFVCVPLIAHGNKMGSLIIIRENIITNEEVHTLTAIADITANVSYRISLYEQTKRDVQRLAALHKIEMAISNNIDIQQIFDTLLDQVINQLHVDAADILVLNQDGLTFMYASGKGFKSNRNNENRGRVGEGLAGTSVLTKSIIYISNHSISDDVSDVHEILVNEKIASYYAIPLITKDIVKGVLEVFIRSQVPPHPDWLEFLQMLGSITAIALENAELFLNLQDTNIELTNAYDATIEGWSHALDLRDKETEGHTQRVTELTVKLAKEMGLSEKDLVHLRRGALLHDIGKMGIPDNILLKPGSLTDEEWNIMRKHPQYAFDMLTPIKYLAKALDIPYCHHEKWDGTGYPRGLRGKEIPFAARIFAVIDVWDALTSDRPYRAAWPKEKTLDYIRGLSGIQFDPEVVKKFEGLMNTSMSK